MPAIKPRPPWKSIFWAIPNLRKSIDNVIQAMVGLGRAEWFESIPPTATLHRSTLEQTILRDGVKVIIARTRMWHHLSPPRSAK